MTVEKYVKVELSLEDKDILLKASEIIDELHDAIGDDEYDIDFEDISHSLHRITYMTCFEINVEG